MQRRINAINRSVSNHRGFMNNENNQTRSKIIKSSTMEQRCFFPFSFIYITLFRSLNGADCQRRRRRSPSFSLSFSKYFKTGKESRNGTLRKIYIGFITVSNVIGSYCDSWYPSLSRQFRSPELYDEAMEPPPDLWGSTDPVI